MRRIFILIVLAVSLFFFAHNTDSDTKIAARYHLRTRTEGFFDRAVETQVASRYHIRTRVKRFFDRSTV